MSTSLIESPLAHLSAEQIEELGREFDAIHDDVYADLGERDRRYIESMIEMHRRLLVFSRVELLAAHRRPAWLVGTATLSLAKILENMEIGHNVLHGQWDWMNDPYIHSSTWDWDTASTRRRGSTRTTTCTTRSPTSAARTATSATRSCASTRTSSWHPVYLFQPLYNLLLASFFEWGVAVHDLDFEAIRKGTKSKAQIKRELKGIAGKARSQVVKDYIAWPLMSGLATGAFEVARGRRRTAVRSGLRAFRSAVTANFTANAIRNVWSYSIIFCGHFPDQTYSFDEAEVDDEQRGAWYVRQLLGAANIEGSPLFHVISGTSATRWSTTCSLTCPARATPRSRPGSRTSASATASPTTRARSCSSSGWCSGRSCGSRFPVEARVRSPAPTAAARSSRGGGGNGACRSG